MLQFLANQATYWLSNEPLSNDERNNSSSSSTSSRDSSSSSQNTTTERLVQPSAEPVDESSSITINDNKETSYSTFTPKADDENRNQTEEVKTHQKDSNEKDEETTCCCANDCCCCDCWREYRFVVIVVVSLLICLAAPLYLLVRHAHFKFDYHKECVTCFKGKQDFEVIFNQTNGTCDLYFENTTYDSNNIVLDPNFCGAPHCQNLELLPGLRLVPYWAVALSAVLSIALSVGVNVIKYNCYLPIKKKFVQWKWNEDVIEENPVIRLSEYEGAIREAVERDACGVDPTDVNSDLQILREGSIFLKTFGLTDPLLFVLLSLFATGHFIFCVVEVVTNPKFAHLDGWHRYQTIYGLFLNSGSIEVLWFWLSMTPFNMFFDEYRLQQKNLTKFLEKNTILVPNQLWKDASENARKLQKTLMMPLRQFESDCVRESSTVFLIGFAIFATAPVFLTHIVPGIVLFIPYWSWILVTLFFLAVLGVCFSESMFLLSCSMYRLFGSFFVFLLFPMIFNWTVLFYEGRTWSDVMTGEYHLRNTDCYFNALVNNIQIYNVGFVGLIFS